MRKFLYLCLLGTALVGYSSYAQFGRYNAMKPRSTTTSTTSNPAGWVDSNLGSQSLKDLQDSGFSINKTGGGASSLIAGKPQTSQDMLGNTTTATQYRDSITGKIVGEKWEMSDGTTKFVTTNDGANAGWKATDTGLERNGVVDGTTVPKVATPAAAPQMDASGVPANLTTDLTQSLKPGEKIGNVPVKTLDDNGGATQNNQGAGNQNSGGQGGTPAAQPDEIGFGSGYTKGNVQNGKFTEDVYGGKSYQLKNSDGSTTNMVYDSATNTYKVNGKGQSYSLENGSFKKISTPTATHNGATTSLNSQGVSTNQWKVVGKDGTVEWKSGLSSGGVAEAGSYKYAGEIYNSSGVITGNGNLFENTNVYRNNETGQFFTGTLNKETGNIEVQSAFQNSGSTAGEYSVQFDPTTKQSIMIGKDGKSFSNFVENGTVIGEGKAGQVTWDGTTGQYKGPEGQVMKYENGKFVSEDGKTTIEANDKMKDAIKEADEAKAAAAAAAKLPDKAVTQNAVEYGIVIAEAVVGNEKTDLTENTTVQGADQVVEAQGTTHESKIISATKDDALSATTIASAANVMIALLQANPLDLTMLDDNACDTGTGSAGQGTTTAGASVGGIDTTAYKKCIKNKRALFAQTVAVASQIIAEGSNAVSARFYDRVNELMTQANGQYVSEFADAHGSLGAISVVNDAERYPYFEMVRGAALSAVQLTAKGAENLVELDVEIKPQETKEGEGEE